MGFPFGVNMRFESITPADNHGDIVADIMANNLIQQG